MEKLSIESYGFSDIGRVRKKNEDVWLELIQTKFFALADGMGGHNAGEVAAKQTIQYLGSFVQKNIPQNISAKQAIALLKKGIQQTNQRIYTLGKSKPTLNGMGTTLCMLYLFPGYGIYAHVGDSRIYRYRDQELKQLTQDHVAYKNEVKNVLTRAIGSGQQVQPEIACASVQVGDLFFLCSDGLSDFISSEQIEKILQSSISLKRIAKRLVELAKEKGSSDNITVVLVRVKHGRKKLYLSG